MFNVRLREVIDGDLCAASGLPCSCPGMLVVLEVNGRPLLEICGCCAAEIGGSLLRSALTGASAIHRLSAPPELKGGKYVQRETASGYPG